MALVSAKVEIIARATNPENGKVEERVLGEFEAASAADALPEFLDVVNRKGWASDSQTEVARAVGKALRDPEDQTED